VTRAYKYRFSVVIPCFNEADFIGATLSSLRAQDISEKYEVIVVDNNCTDETVKIAKQYGARIVNEKRGGVCFARQTGTLKARGEIVLSTDADTTFSPNWLSTIDKSFRDNEKLIAVAGPCRYIDGPWWGKLYTHFLFTSVYVYYLLTGRPFYITATNVAFRKSAWEGYNTLSVQGGDELDLLHSLRNKGEVRFDNSNPTYTSGRRLCKGFTYNFFITFLFYYLGAYYINKIFKRTFIGSAPAFRSNGKLRASPILSIRLASFFALVAVGFIAIPFLRRLVTDNIMDTSGVFKGIWRDLT
jgi:glycosyltransferase involved in cell wall biosynthesis